MRLSYQFLILLVTLTFNGPALGEVQVYFRDRTTLDGAGYFCTLKGADSRASPLSECPDYV
jgi:hypothetical protein